MRILLWTLRVLLFLLLFGFAVKNDQLATLHFFFGSSWQMPLVFIILAAFAAGAVLGVTSTFASLLRYRREVGRLRRDLSKAERSLRSAEKEASGGRTDHGGTV